MVQWYLEWEPIEIRSARESIERLFAIVNLLLPISDLEEFEPDTDSDTESDIESVPDLDFECDTESDSDLDSAPETKSDPEPDSNPDPEPDNTSNSVSDTTSEPEPDTTTNHEPDTIAEANSTMSAIDSGLDEPMLPALPEGWKGDSEDNPNFKALGTLSTPVMRKIEPVGPHYLAFARRKTHGRTFSEDDRIQALSQVRKVEDDDPGEISEEEDPIMLSRDAKDWKVGGACGLPLLSADHLSESRPLRCTRIVKIPLQGY